MMISPAFKELLFYPQFILYRLVPSPRKQGKVDKLPVDSATMKIADAHNTAIWTDYDSALAAANVMGEGYGVGFVLTGDDPFFFLDVDNCIDLETGANNEVAAWLLGQLPGAAVEISQSGKGLHVIGMTNYIAHSCKNSAMGIELYTEGRFVALTDKGSYGNVAIDCTANLLVVVDAYFKPAIGIVAENWRDTPVSEWSGPEHDDELIDKMLKSKSGSSTFGNKASFADLWNNNSQVLAVAYPPLNADDLYDKSSADMALAQHLAFWTGKNHARMCRLMLKSGLVRNKWHSHKTYLKAMTITNAVNRQSDVYISNKPKLAPLEAVENDISVKTWSELSQKSFVEMKWIICSFLPPGVSLIAGRPKQGKSWLVHAFGLLVAAGRPVFGYAATKSDVLYLALEDSERRLQGRTRKLMLSHGLTDKDIDGFHYSIDAPKLSEGLEEQIAQKLKLYPNIRFVIIDVLARIRTGRRGNQSVYEADYEVGQRLKRIGSLYSEVAFLIVHHQNKGQGDALDSISGTHGLAGGFDNTYGLVSGSGGVELHIDGRDIEDSAPIPLLKGSDGMWTLESREAAVEVRNSDTRNAILNAIGIGEATPKQISEITGIDSNTISSSLRRMVKQFIVVKVSHGKYKGAPKPETIFNHG